MEHIYKIKVKRKFDSRSQYPSERRYSASTVFGFAWVHLALAATAFLLACLALHNPVPDEINPSSSIDNRSTNTTMIEETTTMAIDEFEGAKSFDDVPIVESAPKKMYDPSDLPEHLRRDTSDDYSSALILSPCLVAVAGLLAGLAAVLASKRWYLDHSIAWFLAASALAAILSAAALCMIIMWIVEIHERGSHFCDYFAPGTLFAGKAHVEEVFDADANKTTGHYYVIKVPFEELRARDIPLLGEEPHESRARKVLSINILIAAAVELIWSLLSVKIAWCGTMASYPEEDGRGVNGGSSGTVHVITEIKGNNTKRLPKSTRILPPRPDLIEHHPKDGKIRRLFEAQRENGGFFLHPNESGEGGGFTVVDETQDRDAPSGFSKRESSAEYRERMLNYLNKCTPEAPPPDVQQDLQQDQQEETAIAPAPVVMRESRLRQGDARDSESTHSNRLSTISWGDRPEYPVFTPATLDLETIVHLRLPAATVCRGNQLNKPEEPERQEEEEENGGESVEQIKGDKPAASSENVDKA